MKHLCVKLSHLLQAKHQTCACKTCACRTGPFINMDEAAIAKKEPRCTEQNVKTPVYVIVKLPFHTKFVKSLSL